MGHTYATVTLYGPGLSTSREIEFLVDTGSTYTWAARSVLEGLQVKPYTARGLRTTDGRTLKREIGETVMEYDGERATRLVVFAEPGDSEVLGVDALEGLGLEVDPVTQRLRKAEALLAL